MKSNYRKGWLCVIGSGFNYIATLSSLQLNTLFIGPVTESYGCTVTETSMIYSMSSLGCMIMSLLLTKLMEKSSPKTICIIGSFTSLVYYTGMALTSNIHVLWLLSIILGFGTVMCGIAMDQIMITSWFSRGGGKIASITTWATSLVKMLITPAVALLISRAGMRKAAFILGVTITSINLFNSIVLICNSPQSYGMQRIAFGKEPKKQEKHGQNGSAISLPVSRLVRMPVMWIAMLGVLLWTIVNTLHNSNASLIYQSMGLDSIQAAYMISIDGLSAGLFGVLYGVLCDSLGPKRGTLMIAGIGAATFLAAPSLSGIGGAILLAIMVGGIECSALYGMMVLPSVFGSKSSATLISWSVFFGSAGSFIAPPLAASLAEFAGGSYHIAQIVGGILYLAVMGIVVLLYSHRTESRLQKENEAYLSGPSVSE